MSLLQIFPLSLCRWEQQQRKYAWRKGKHKIFTHNLSLLNFFTFQNSQQEREKGTRLKADFDWIFFFSSNKFSKFTLLLWSMRSFLPHFTIIYRQTFILFLVETENFHFQQRKQSVALRRWASFHQLCFHNQAHHRLSRAKTWKLLRFAASRRWKS